MLTLRDLFFQIFDLQVKMGDTDAAQFARIRSLGTNGAKMYSSQQKEIKRYHFEHLKQYFSEAAAKENYKCGRTKSARIKQNIYEVESEFPRMQTMDRRVSSSSDQIDRLRMQGLNRKPKRTNSSSQLPYERRTKEKDCDKDNFVTGKVHRKCDLLKPNLPKYDSRQEHAVKKTPLALFLEDDGPYSRKLFRSLGNRTKVG